MKQNAKYFNMINTEPIAVQTTKFGTVEIHSLNQYPTIYNQYVSKGRFTMWCVNGGDVFKLLIEDSFYSELKDLYAKRPNEAWLEYYHNVEKTRKNNLYKVFIPGSIIALSLFAIISFAIPEDLQDLKTYSSFTILIIFFIINIFVNKKINKCFAKHNIDAVEKIQSIIGYDKFADLVEKQEKFMKDFYDKQYEELYPNDTEREELNEIIEAEQKEEQKQQAVQHDYIDMTNEVSKEEEKENE